MNGRTVEPSNLSEVKEPQVEDNRLGRVKSQTCPYGKECGYEGVFMWTRLFDEHMVQYHPGKAVRNHKDVI